MTIKYFKNKEFASKAVFYKIIEDIERQKKDTISIGFSGGSSPLLFFEYLNEYLSKKVNLQKKIYFSWVDERMVPYNSPRSNYGEAKKYFPILSHMNTVFPIPNLENIEEFSKVNIERAFKKAPFFEKGNLEFDILVLGMGDDGHTASIFQDVKPLGKIKDYVYVKHPTIDENRISMSLDSINKCKKKYLMVFGESKKDILKKSLSEKCDLPASRVIDENVLIFTDILL